MAWCGKTATSRSDQTPVPALSVRITLLTALEELTLKLTVVATNDLRQAGDEVLEINDTVVTEMKLFAVTQLILGPTGSKVSQKSLQSRKHVSTQKTIERDSRSKMS